jgi:hypothetical protein
MRKFAAFLLIASMALFTWSLREVVRAESRGAFVATVASAYGEHLQAHDWAAHWRAAFLEQIALSLFLALSGFLIWHRRAIGFLGLAVSLVLQPAADLIRLISGHTKYAFEQLEPVYASIYIVCAATAVVLFARLRRASRAADPAPN